MPRLFIHAADSTACTYYRAYLPHRHCREPLAALGIELEIGTAIPEDADAYMFHRLIRPDLMPLVYDLRASGRPIVWDLDDNVFRVPEWSPAARQFTPEALRMVRWCLGLATHVTVSTTPLRDFLGLDATVLPNLVDPQPYLKVGRIGRSRMPGRIPRILWAGSPTHQRDIELLVPVVQRMIERTNCQWIFVGDIPEALRTFPTHQVTHLAGCPIRHYPQMLRLIDADVAVLPLVDCEFNECKSPIKFYEMTLAGAICVASNVGPYAVIDDGHNGFLTEDDPDDWCDRINDAMIAWHEVLSIPAAAQMIVVDYCTWNPVAPSWCEGGRNQWVNFFASLFA